MNKKAKNKSVPCFDMQFITSSISTTLVLLLLGLVVFFVLGAHNLSVYVKENINFSILISDDMKESDILKLQKKLDKEPFVKETEYISKKQALREQTEAMGTDPQEFLGYNPFTASIEIRRAVLNSLTLVFFMTPLLVAIKRNLFSSSLIPVLTAIIAVIFSFSTRGRRFRIKVPLA